MHLRSLESTQVWCTISAKKQTCNSTSNFTVVNIGLYSQHRTLLLSTTDLLSTTGGGGGGGAGELGIFFNMNFFPSCGCALIFFRDCSKFFFSFGSLRK